MEYYIADLNDQHNTKSIGKNEAGIGDPYVRRGHGPTSTTSGDLYRSHRRPRQRYFHLTQIHHNSEPEPEPHRQAAV